MSLDLKSTSSRDSLPGRRIVSAFFDTHGAAEKASEDLIAAGIPRDRIALTSGQGAGEAVTDTAPRDGAQRGFWQSLKDLFLPEQDQNAYAEGLRRGGYLLTVRTDDAGYDLTLSILDADGAVNMDEREGLWRSEGWSSGSVDTDLAEGGQTSKGLFGAMDHDPALVAGTAPATAADASPIASRGVSGQNPSLVQSTASRDLSHGRARVRGYINPEAPMGSFSAETDRDRIVEHMDVIASDGANIGTVDHLDGPDRIKLAKNTAPDGQHHFVPLAWVDHIDTHVHLNRTAEDVKAAW